MKDLVEKHCPEAERIHLVIDNLNTHSPASLYDAFPPEEARRITKKLVFHYTPKHGSWLNQAEIEFSVLQSGRDRVFSAGEAVFGPKDSRRSDFENGDQSLGGEKKPSES
jgi:hypothetical protein